MSRPPDQRNDKVEREANGIADCCNGCHEPLVAPAIEGLCPKCLLIQPFAGMWDPHQPPTIEEVSEALPRFKIQKVLGRGALGAVYGAVDTQLDRIVAIKAMFSNQENPEFAVRFAREATAMAKLNHPQIVTIYDHGAVGDLHYLVMERMEGGTLSSEIASKERLSTERALAVIRDVSAALQFAHSNGVVHRDVKPSNILLDSVGNAKLSDFGLVKGLLPEEFADVALTRTNMTVGTPLYMAPEQVEWPAQANHRADVYSAGAVFYEMLTGKPPQGRYEPASKIHGVPRWLDEVIDRALHKEPSERYPFADDLTQDIQRRLAPKQRWMKGLTLIISLVALTALGALAMQAKRPQEPDRASREIPVTQEDIAGLPLDIFEKEINLKDWFPIATYDFEERPSDSLGSQSDFTMEEGAWIEDGSLHLESLEQRAYVHLKRAKPEVPRGLAVNFRFFPESYLGLGKANTFLFEFSLHWTQGFFLQTSKWGDPLPTFLIENREPMAPPGVIEPKFTTGQWHDVWMVLTDNYRLWIDGVPVYRTRATANLGNWERWIKDQGVTLMVQGFRGKVDHIRVLEQDRG